MKIVNEILLAEFRTAGRCEWCGAWCRVREPSHLWGRGFGGGTRLDVRINLMGKGSTANFECGCHNAYHAGKIGRNELLSVVAAREQCVPDDIEVVIWLLKRLPKDPTPAKLEAEFDEMTSAQIELAIEALAEHLDWLA